MFLQLKLVFSLPVPDKTQCFVHLRFNSTLQLVNVISSDLQKLALSNNLHLYLKGLKAFSYTVLVTTCRGRIIRTVF